MRLASLWKSLCCMIFLASWIQTSGRALAKGVDELSPSEISTRIQQVYRQVIPNLGVIFSEKGEHLGTATIISADGVMLTHGHHGFPPGTSLRIRLAEGKQYAAKFLGVNEVTDLSLLQLKTTDRFSTVPLAKNLKSLELSNCVCLGYPKVLMQKDVAPVFRLGKINMALDMMLMSTCKIQGGDSGGPLLNLNGELIGVNRLLPLSGAGSGHVSIEAFQRTRNDLESGVHTRLKTDAPILSVSDTRFADAARASLVTFWVDQKKVANGVVAGPGLIVSKASELSGESVCKMRDGKQIQVKLKKVDIEHDLAWLSTEEKLPVVTWNDSIIQPGELLAAVMDNTEIRFGICSGPVRSIPGEEGQLAFTISSRDGVTGVFIDRVFMHAIRTSKLLKPGDRLVELQGKPVMDKQHYVKLYTEMQPTFPPIGSTISAVIMRGDEKLPISLPVEHTKRVDPEFSMRQDAFRRVFTHDIVMLKSECGSPIINMKGECVGLLIAVPEHDVCRYAIPAAVIMHASQNIK